MDRNAVAYIEGEVMDEKKNDIVFPTVLECDGVYVRVNRNGKYISRCFSDLTKIEQEQFLATLDIEGLKRLCQILSMALRNLQE